MTKQVKTEKTNKTSYTADDKLNIQLSKITKRILIALTIGLPILAWALGALINPSGWASEDPSIIAFVVIYIPIYFWFISIPVIIVLIALGIKRKKNLVTLLVFLISLVASVYIIFTTANASESEFTG